MNSLVAYGSDEENDDRNDQGSRGGGILVKGARREDDTNYDEVTMDMSEDSNNNESDRELPPADQSEADRGDVRTSTRHKDGKERSSSPRRDRRHNEKERDRSSRDREKEKDRRPRGKDRDRREDRRTGRGRYERSSSSTSSRRGLGGDKPDDRKDETKKVPALMELKPFGGEPPPLLTRHEDKKDTKDTKDHRASERDRREHERERDKDRDKERDRHRGSHRDAERSARRSPDRKHKRSRSRERRSSRDRRERSHDKPALDILAAPLHSRGGLSSISEFRPSYKVSKKLQVMEKMGLQIKTPDGSMATAQQLMQRTVSEQHSGGAAYFKPGAVASSLVAQVEKRKLLWSKKSAEGETSEPKPIPEAAAKWTGTKFSQDTDGKVANKFMRLMGIKQPEMVKVESESDVNAKQERMFQEMQAQYEVARATTHTMRGVGLGFQRHL